MQRFSQSVILTRRYLRNPDDDSEDDSSSDSSPPPIARRSKFDDEEDDSDVCPIDNLAGSDGTSSKFIRSSIRGMLLRIPRSNAKRPKKQLRLKPRQMRKQLQTRNQKHSE